MKNVFVLIFAPLFVLLFGIISIACDEEGDIYRCENKNPYTPVIEQCFEFAAGTSEDQAAEWCENLTIGIRVVEPVLFVGACDVTLYDAAGYCNCDMNDEDPEGGCHIKHAEYDGFAKGMMMAQVAPELVDPEMDCWIDETFSAAWGCDQWGGKFECFY